MSHKILDTLLVGVGGYGDSYVRTFKDGLVGNCRIAGAVDAVPSKCPSADYLKSLGLEIEPDLSKALSRRKYDLAVLSTPIQLHHDHTVTALEAGSNVLCEKPLCAATSEAYDMLKVRDKAGLKVAIGYQWSFSAAIQKLKADIAKGLYGRPLRLRTIVRWIRMKSYYTRNDWAGMLRDSKGRLVLDSPVNNANAHYLHNMFYVLGKTPSASAVPRSVQGEIYRANEITNYDTAALRCLTSDGVEIMFLASHATETNRNICFEFLFEGGKVCMDASKVEEIFGYPKRGKEIKYGSPNEGAERKLILTAEAVIEGREPLCGIESSLSHTACMNGLQKSGDPIIEFPKDLVHTGKTESDSWKWIEGLDKVMDSCYDSWKLPSEAGAPWARKGREIKL